MNINEFDVNKILKNGVPEGKDPDKYSKLLKEYHICLWSSRKVKKCKFILKNGNSNKMILNTGEHEIIFTPDSITNIFQNSNRKYNSRKELEIVEEHYNIDSDIKKYVDEFNNIDYTIGSSLIFPTRIDNQSIGWTLNRTRGISYKIHDRIDLTLKCIKMYYENNSEYNPLLDCIKKNRVFFDLFDNFKEYVDFFFLNDLVDDNYNVKGFDNILSFDNPFPTSIEQYKLYLINMINFIKNRNLRIEKWVKEWK